MQILRSNVSWAISVVLLAGLLTLPPERAAHSGGAAQYQVLGIDVSHHNGEVDWSKLSGTGVEFVILKATDGIDWLDPLFVYNFRKLAGQESLIRGAYHYYQYADDPVEQADWFISNVALVPGDFPPIVDIEKIPPEGHETFHADLYAFLGRLEEHYQAEPIVYSGRKIWNAQLAETLGDYPLWIAEYGVVRPDIPVREHPWVLWQFTDEYQVPGSEKNVDASYFNGDINGFRGLLLKEE